MDRGQKLRKVTKRPIGDKEIFYLSGQLSRYAQIDEAWDGIEQPKVRFDGESELTEFGLLRNRHVDFAASDKVLCVYTQGRWSIAYAVV